MLKRVAVSLVGFLFQLKFANSTFSNCRLANSSGFATETESILWQSGHDKTSLNP